ncbi:MAG: hypothetical protein ACTSV7_06220 [Candidatus Baldrarchaeia archaeon]
MNTRTILLYLGIVSYILAIVEKLSNLGILNWLYSTIDKTTVLYALIILGTAFIVAYCIDLKFRKERIFFATTRRRPYWARGDYDYEANDYGVEWHLFVHPYDKGVRPWADGPYCPKCKRELEEKRTGILFKKMEWFCPICNTTFPKPKGNVKEMVEKNFAAYLREKGKL